MNSIPKIYNVFPGPNRSSGVRSYAQLLERIVRSVGVIDLESLPLSSNWVDELPRNANVLVHIGVNEGEIYSFLKDSKKYRPDIRRIILMHDPPLFPHEKTPFFGNLGRHPLGRGLRRAINYMLEDFFDSQVLQCKDDWITLSECGKDALQFRLTQLGHFKPPVSIPLGLYQEPRSHLKSPTKAISVGYFGYITPSKGVNFLIDVADYIANTLHNNDIRFVISGTPDSKHSQMHLESKLKKIQPLLGDGIVSIIKPFDDAALPNFLNSIDILALPYNRPKSYSASGPLHWAWTCGLPVIASESPYFIEKLRTSAAGIVVSTKDKQIWASEICRYAKDIQFRMQFFEATQKMQALNSWENVAYSLLDAINH